MTHQHFDIVDCVAMPTVRFVEKVEPEWIRPDTLIHVPRFVFQVPAKFIPALCKIDEEVNPNNLEPRKANRQSMAK